MTPPDVMPPPMTHPDVMLMTARRAASGIINWRSVWTFYVKEVRRFLSILAQSVAAPVVTTVLFYIVFTLAFDSERSSSTLSFERFLVPGLIMLAVMQNAFANPSFSLMLAKVQGNIVDIFMPPLNPGEIVAAYALAGMTRGILVGGATLAALVLIAPGTVEYPLHALFYCCAGALMLSILGLIAGALCEKFDHIAALTNFIILPLVFLSGTFYPLSRLPPALVDIALFNPFFYLIDGFRYAMTGVHEGSLFIGALVVIVLDIILWMIAWAIFRYGFCLKM